VAATQPAGRRATHILSHSVSQHLAARSNFLYAKYALVNNTYLKYAKLVGKNAMVRGRPERYPVKKVVGFDQEMLDAIDNWRRQQKPIPTVSDAIRELLQKALSKPPETGQGK
jgi:hypothetical protein